MDVRGVRIRVLTLEAQIAVKEEVGGEKDAAMLPLLRKTLQESRRENTQND
jgi:predicted nucleotidyltransferase